VGIPAAATNLIQPLSTAFATWMLSQFGSDIVAGFGVASRIEAVAGMVVIGISTSVVPLVGQNWGARQFDRVQQALTICYIACIIWGLIAAIVLWFGASFFVGSINDDPDLMETAVTFLHIIPISIGFMGLITVANHAFNALRQPMPALILSIARLLIVYVPLALVGSYLYGYVGVFAATALANILVGVFAVYWHQKVMARSRRHFEQENAGNVPTSGSLYN
jgi:Na+-driven multidrug efflux pump